MQKGRVNRVSSIFDVVTVANHPNDSKMQLGSRLYIRIMQVLSAPEGPGRVARSVRTWNMATNRVESPGRGDIEKHALQG
jgi:hypothetical protein